MNVNKKFDRFKQWAGERMGSEAKTNVSDDFKALEAEMNLRHEGERRLVSNCPVDRHENAILTFTRDGSIA